MHFLDTHTHSTSKFEHKLHNANNLLHLVAIVYVNICLILNCYYNVFFKYLASICKVSSKSIVNIPSYLSKARGKYISLVCMAEAMFAKLNFADEGHSYMEKV